MALRISHLFAVGLVGIIAGLLLTQAAVYVYEGALPDEALRRGAPVLPDDIRLAEKELRKVEERLDALRRSRPYIVVDTNANEIYLRSEGSVMLKASCSTGSGGELEDEATGRKWRFATPLGAFRVESKLVDPWWRKPDWAFIEDSLAVPSDPKDRLDPEMLGEYALGFGNGYFIHGTVYERLLGVSVTHGCVRVGSDDLERIYGKVDVGTAIYVF
jgi:hypothetical protein